jgi:transposase
MGKQSDNRNRLLVLYECGIKSAKKLHQFTGIPLSTIYDHLKRFQTGKGSKRKVGSGRPPKLNANDRRRVAQLANTDLNCIENVWQIMKDIIEKLEPKNLEDWKKKIREIWDELSHDYLETLIASMPRRLQLCIEAGGEHINY